jgi:hypothetical protein
MTEAHQTNFLDPPKKHVPLQPTSVAAAKVAEGHVARDERLILDYLRAHPQGTTYDGLSLALTIPLQTICWRMNGLRKAGQVIDSGKKGKTRTGATAIVWVLR